jgi:hypothetical protein
MDLGPRTERARFPWSAAGIPGERQTERGAA